ncbi:MAG: response regulator [Candidatus Sungbacteria bacterium]|nr:response regulator [Candidatus Sungbacteria bacterium]
MNYRYVARTENLLIWGNRMGFNNLKKLVKQIGVLAQEIQETSACLSLRIVMENQTTPVESKAAASPETAQTAKTILLVDDDEFLLDLYTTTFREDGFQVVGAHDGQEAWDGIQQGARPDIILTGILMPHMTGFELIEKMKADAILAKIPVVMFSHRGLAEHERQAKELGANDFIVQNTTTPADTKRRVKLLLGIPVSFRIQMHNSMDGQACLGVLNKFHGTRCSFNEDGEVILEIATGPERGLFVITPVCKTHSV